MKARNSVFSMLLIFALSCLVATHAFALKVQDRVTPESQHNSGFMVQTTKRDNGSTRFQITRDLTKARSHPADSELFIDRSAILKIYGPNGLVAECEVAFSQKQHLLTYEFSLAPEYVANSHFTLIEIDNYKETARVQLIGGGTYYEFQLADFVAQKTETK